MNEQDIIERTNEIQRLIQSARQPVIDKLEKALEINRVLLEALEELQKGIYDFAELPIYAKNFVYRITDEAIHKAKGDSR